MTLKEVIKKRTSRTTHVLVFFFANISVDPVKVLIHWAARRARFYSQNVSELFQFGVKYFIINIDLIKVDRSTDTER